jgi:thiamine pyrophosphate-dependent acetolactate synthase large subunit-like protein
MMAETVADFPVEPLIEWWVSRIYGYPGGGINGITTALRRGGHGCDFVCAAARRRSASIHMPSRLGVQQAGELPEEVA